MNIQAFYEADDADRLLHTLRNLGQHDLSRWALTGGTAIEHYLQQMGAPTCTRPLHDLDFIAAGFDCLPGSLASALLLRHVHPHDPPAKTMLQAVDPKTSIRVDVFRAYGFEMERTQSIAVSETELRIVAFEDLVARHARLCCGLLRGETLAPKYARDFLRMVNFVESESIEPIWREHRKATDPGNFAEAVAVLLEAIAAHPELLIAPVYSTDVDEVCPRCESTAAFRLADARQVFAHLGYC
ncbi:MAG: hypothetical protein WCF68_00080 [Terriglobales bacterium]